jgi:hypothetical protein
MEQVCICTVTPWTEGERWRSLLNKKPVQGGGVPATGFGFVHSGQEKKKDKEEGLSGPPATTGL